MKFAEVNPTTKQVLLFPLSFQELQARYTFLKFYSLENINYNLVSLPEGIVKVFDKDGREIDDSVPTSDLGPVFYSEPNNQYRCTYSYTPEGGIPHTTDPATLLERVKNDQLRKLSLNAESLVAGLIKSHITPQFEIQTWNNQMQEALAWEADNTVATPMLDGIATFRNIPSELLKQKTLEKVKAYQMALAIIIGKRQAIEDSILAATTVEDVLAISVIVTL